MAFLGQFSGISNVSGTSVTATVPAGGYPEGTQLIASVATAHGSTVLVSGSDPGSNVWSDYTGQAYSGGMAMRQLGTKITTALNAGDVITFSTSTASARMAASVLAFSAEDNITALGVTASDYSETAVTNLGLPVAWGGSIPSNIVVGSFGFFDAARTLTIPAPWIDTGKVATTAGTNDIAVQVEFQYVVAMANTTLAATADAPGFFVGAGSNLQVRTYNSSPVPVTFQSMTTVPLATRTNTTIDIPTGIANGDGLVLYLLTRNPTEAVNPSVPIGWAQNGSALDISLSGVNAELRLYNRTALNEPATLTITHASSDTQAVMLHYTGVDPSSTYNQMQTAAGTGTTSTVSPTGVVSAGQLLLWAGLDWADAGIDRVPPGGTDPVFTERYDVGPVFIADGIRNVSTTMTSRSMTNNSLATSSWSAEIARLNFEEKFDGYLRTTGNTTTASVTSLTVEVPPEGYPVGTSLMALVGTTHVAATTMTATDPRGNTWTTLQSGFNTSASPGVAGWLIHTKVTTALVGGDLITFTASAAATRWSITISSFSDDITPSHGVVNNYGNGSAPVTYTSGPITTTATNSLIFGGHASGNQLQAISQQTGDDAVISTWWLPAGTSLPIRSVRGQYRYKAPGTYELQLACTVTGPVVSFAQAFTVSGPAPPASGLKVWDGSTWVDGNPKVWDGAAWVLGSAKVWDGSAWI